MPPKVIYLMGAGRSGTTVLAVLLRHSDDVSEASELHHLPQHLQQKKTCSCGSELANCPFWGDILRPLMSSYRSKEYSKQASKLEDHSHIYRYFFPRANDRIPSCYRNASIRLFQRTCGMGAIVDSAKYIGRALALNNVLAEDIRFIHLTRDPRGVVSSFQKSVQSPRHWLSATIYYLLVNTMAEVVSRTLLRGKVLQLNYETLIRRPEVALSAIGKFADIDTSNIIKRIEENKAFGTGHFIGGNRLVRKSSIHLRRTDPGPSRLEWWKRFVVWVLTFPLNILYGYRP